MIGLHCSSLLVLCATLVGVSYANLMCNFSHTNITILSPGDAGYSTASTACKSFRLLSSDNVYLIFHDITVNWRFTFEPAAIAYPKTAHDVSAVLHIAQQCHYQVVARSGGVCPLLSNQPTHLSDCSIA